MLNRVETIHSINSLVSKNIPFLFIISFNQEQNIVFPFDKLLENNIFFSTPGAEHMSESAFISKLEYFKRNPVPFTDYKILFEKVKSEIQKGNSFLLNLTVPTEIETNLNLYQLFEIATARYKLFYDNKFIVFSPESFVTIENGLINTFPMKGTIKADIPDALNIILNDNKEAAEHATIVDLLRNDLSIVASDVKVKRFRYAELLQTNFGPIYQISSEVQGKLPDNFRSKLGETLFSLLPAGSVTGAPKNKTLEIIRQVEVCPREYYTGVFGVWDTQKLESAVMIRFIRKEGDKFWFHSGGGITFQSNCESEYKELIDKVYVPIR